MRQRRVAKWVHSSLLFAVLLMASYGAWAASSGSHKVSITARARTSRNRIDPQTTAKQKKEWFVETVTEGESETCTLLVTRFNRGEQTEDYQIEWYFLSEKLKGKLINGRREKPVKQVFQSGNKKISLAAGEKTTEEFISNEFVLNKSTVNSKNDSGDERSHVILKGHSYLGYIILVVNNGEIVAKHSGSLPYLKDEWIEKCRNFKPGR